MWALFREAEVDAEALSLSGCILAVVGAELAQDGCHVVIDGALRHEQFLRNLSIAESAADQAKDL